MFGLVFSVIKLPDNFRHIKSILVIVFQILIYINENSFNLDLNRSIGENANNIYSKGKKADQKLKGTIIAIEKTKEKIDKLKLDRELKLFL